MAGTNSRVCALVAVVVMVVAGCGADDESGTAPVVATQVTPAPSVAPPPPTLGGGRVVPGPLPDGAAPRDVCGDLSAAVAAYDLTTGAVRWLACSSDGTRRTVLDATDEYVYVVVDTIDPQHGPQQQVVAYNTTNGTVREGVDASVTDPAIPEPSNGDDLGVEIDGVRISSTQEGPNTSGHDVATGNRWSQPGRSAYDDVVAVDDRGVYVVDGARFVAYALRSGDVLWEVPQPSDYSWPWRAEGGRLFAIWTNLHVIDNEDGSTVWRTDYPPAEFPRMSGVDANADTVFVAFSGVASGGD